MADGEQARTWIEVAAAAVAAIGGYVKLKSIKDDTKASRYQVENDHDDDSNLREDVTEMKTETRLQSSYLRDIVTEQLRGLHESFSHLNDNVSGLRRELGQERSARREAIQGLNDKLDSHLNGKGD